MPRTLFVSAFTPERVARHAGGRAAFENLQRLLEAGQAVDVVVCTTEREAASDPSYAVVRHGWIDFFLCLLRGLGRYTWRSVLAAPILHTRLNARLQQVLAQRLATRDYARVHVEFTQALFVVQDSLRRAGRDLPVTVFVHDLFVQRLLRAPGFLATLLTGFVMKEEKTILARAREVIVSNAKDATLLRELYNLEMPISVKTFIVPDWCRAVVRAPDARHSGRVLFFANFDRPENAAAARWFIEGPWNEVRRRVASATLTLGGAGSERIAQRLGGPGVRGTGFVADPSELFAQCSCAIAPLMEGAGVKFKVLEALACGVPVIGTPVAFEGIAPIGLMIPAGPEDFADKTVALLQGS